MTTWNREVTRRRATTVRSSACFDNTTSCLSPVSTHTSCHCSVASSRESFPRLIRSICCQGSNSSSATSACSTIVSLTTVSDTWTCRRLRSSHSIIRSCHTSSRSRTLNTARKSSTVLRSKCMSISSVNTWSRLWPSHTCQKPWCLGTMRKLSGDVRSPVEGTSWFKIRSDVLFTRTCEETGHNSCERIMNSSQCCMIPACIHLSVSF